jgi:DNA sulfur modification protein DndC
MSEERITGEKIQQLQEKIREVYVSDSRPWVVGYSGGKDSSCVLQLVWYALRKLPAEKLKKPVYVISSDTLVETPAVVNQLDQTLKQIDMVSKREGMPIEVHKVIPAIQDTFWVNMIGRGLPAPYTNFRWCTDRMKIAPTTSFIKKQIAEYGEVTILLGSRRTESSSRGQVMANRRDKGAYLSWHNDIANALVFTPIEDWHTNDVWEYLMAVPSPWGGRNDAIVTMYRNAQAGECPLVIDKSTPSCGGGRFGCWTCTVVQKDRSMEAMIENGEDWMQPMLDMRDWLTETQIPENKPKIRDHRRRNGRVEFFDAGGDKRIVWGPYKLEFRKEILRRLLRTQKLVRESGPDPSVWLIQPSELHKIRQLWLHDEGDWEDELPKIFEEETGETLDWFLDDHAGVGGVEKQILEDIASEWHLPADLLRELLDVERSHAGMSRRSGIYDKIDSVFNKDWRSRDEVLSHVENQPGIDP